MEVKEWSYEEYPSFDEQIDGEKEYQLQGTRRVHTYFLMLNMHT